MIDRLEEDHRNARFLAEGLAKIDGISIDLRRVQTNIVVFNISDLGIDAKTFISMLKDHGVLAYYWGKSIIRMVTHRGIEREHIERALNIIEEVVKEVKSKYGR